MQVTITFGKGRERTSFSPHPYCQRYESRNTSVSYNPWDLDSLVLTVKIIIFSSKSDL